MGSMPQCIPHRRFVSRDNRPGLAHHLTFYTFHALPVLSTSGWFERVAASVRSACGIHQTQVWAYSFLPNHVRLLVKPALELYDLRGFVNSLKDCIEDSILESSDRQQLRVLRISSLHRGRRYRLWQQGTGPIEAVSNPAAAEKLRAQCHHAAVDFGLVTRAEQWPWSSLHWVSGKRNDEIVPMATWESDWEVKPLERRITMMH